MRFAGIDHQLFVLAGLFNPLLIQQIIDGVISQGNFSSLNVLGTLLVVIPSPRRWDPRTTSFRHHKPH